MFSVCKLYGVQQAFSVYDQGIFTDHRREAAIETEKGQEPQGTYSSVPSCPTPLLFSPPPRVPKFLLNIYAQHRGKQVIHTHIYSSFLVFFFRRICESECHVRRRWYDEGRLRRENICFHESIVGGKLLPCLVRCWDMSQRQKLHRHLST